MLSNYIMSIIMVTFFYKEVLTYFINENDVNINQQW